MVSEVCIKNFFLHPYRRGTAKIPSGSKSNEYLAGVTSSGQRVY